MKSRPGPPPVPVDLDSYLRLFQPYETQLREFTVREGEYGARFALLFRQVVRMLVKPAAINERMPKLYLALAERYLGNDHDTVRHFSYEENRYFFLMELMDWLRAHQRGEAMRQSGT